MPELRPSLRLTIERQVLWTIVRLSGELGWESRAALEDCLTELVHKAEQPRICLDVSGLEFCDSSGIACMMRALRAVREKDGALSLLRPRANLARMLTWMGLERVLPVVDQLPG
jgi:anti-sigma B factor antagonist